MKHANVPFTFTKFIISSKDSKPANALLKIKAIKYKRIAIIRLPMVLHTKIYKELCKKPTFTIPAALTSKAVLYL